MERNFFISVIAIWMLLSNSIQAGSVKGIFNLKEGDWFEVQVTKNIPYNNPEFLGTSENYLFNFRYTLLKQLNSGNQVYSVIVKRVKCAFIEPDGTFGRDTYYPPFIRGKKENDRNNQYTIEVSPLGEIRDFRPDIHNTVKSATLHQLNPKKNYFLTCTKTVTYSDSFYISEFSQRIFLPFSNSAKTASNKLFRILKTTETASPEVLHSKAEGPENRTLTVSFIKQTNVPLMVSGENLNIVLTSASFSIPGNTIIKGKIISAGRNEIEILDKYHYKMNPDGTFYCPILLTEPSVVDIFIDNYLHKTFLAPGDTLDISSCGSDLVQRGTPVLQYNGKTIKYAGQAAFNTMLMKDGYTQIIDNNSQFLQDDKILWGELDAFIKAWNSTKELMDKIIKSHEGKASSEYIDFVRTEFNYYLANIKLEYLFKNFYSDSRNEKRKTLTKLTDYPRNFFIEADTMPVLLNNYKWGKYYKRFLNSVNTFKSMRLSMSVGHIRPLEDISLLKASLEGAPLYYCAFDFLNREITRSYTSMKENEPDYIDFINNCNDPVLVDSLKRVYEIANLMAPGKVFAVKTLQLLDSSNFNIYSFKGKPVCLVFAKWNINKIEILQKEIEKFKPGEVEFLIFVMRPFTDLNILRSLQNLPNVHILQLREQTVNNFLLFLGDRRIIVLDKWYRIFDDNIPDPVYNTGANRFEQTIRKAIDAKRYSKEEKTTIYRTAGWSLGSILITFLAGFWVYRYRVRRIKQQEAVKRQIKELEIKAVRSQMNPHFIFNALNSIQSLINSNQIKDANIYLTKFALLLRGVLHNSEKTRVPLSDELEALQLYCQLEQLRFEFNLEIAVEEGINCELIEIPGMIIQPLAENAIVHGLSSKDGERKLNIQIKQQHGYLHIFVSDNGLGLPAADNDQLRQKGFGLKLVEERLMIINRDGKPASLNIVNKRITNGADGTIAELTLPID